MPCRLALLLTLAGVLFAMNAALAAGPVGWVQEASGVVTIHSGGAASPATIGKGVAPRDKVVTGAGSRVQIMFKDKTTLALAEKSECQIGDVHLEAADKSAARFSLSIVKGIFGLLAGAISEHNPDGFEVETPLVSVGIRGTEFVSAVFQNQEAHGLYEGGPVVVTATQFKKTGAAAKGGEELCEAMKDTIKAMERAYRSKWGAGSHSEARKFEAKAEEYEKLLPQYGCQ